MVNLSTAPTTTTNPVAACQVELEFWDAAGKLVKSSSIANLAPGTAGSLNLKLAEVTTNTSPLRTEIRGVVRSNPISPTASGGSTTPPLLPVVYSQWCNVMTTLEVFDNSTGVTQAFTSDTRALQSGILPLARAVLDPQ